MTHNKRSTAERALCHESVCPSCAAVFLTTEWLPQGSEFFVPAFLVARRHPVWRRHLVELLLSGALLRHAQRCDARVVVLASVAPTAAGILGTLLLHVLSWTTCSKGFRPHGMAIFRYWRNLVSPCHVSHGCLRSCLVTPCTSMFFGVPLASLVSSVSVIMVRSWFWCSCVRCRV